MSGPEVGTFIVVAIFVIAGIAIAVAWVVLPFTIRARLRDVLEEFSQVRALMAEANKRLGVLDSSVKNLGATRSSEAITSCKCHVCSGKLEFNSALFDSEHPPTITCPHCGVETELYLPRATSPQ